MSEIINIFPLTVYKSKITLKSQDKEKMIKEILSMRDKSSKDSSTFKKKNNSWTGDVSGFDQLHNDSNFLNLFKNIQENIKKYCENLFIDHEQIDFYFQRSWATVSSGPENISAHKHDQSHLSFAYYLKKNEKDSKIYFLDSSNQNEFIPRLFSSESINKKNIIKKRNFQNSPRVNINIEEDDIVIFPSKTLHATEPNINNEERISISADIICVAKEAKYLENLIPPLNNWKKF
tara:strand:+ start:37 stop:738 length:702 start_codon:yes stop_codon:yes gene_type:complete